MILTNAKNEFVLETKQTSYAFRVLPTGQLEHLYYGRKIRLPQSVPVTASESAEKIDTGSVQAINAEADKPMPVESALVEKNQQAEKELPGFLGLNALTEKHTFGGGNLNVYDAAFPEISLEDMRLEMSAYGKSDIREPFLEIVHADGSFTSDFRFAKAEILQEKPEFETLPGSYFRENQTSGENRSASEASGENQTSGEHLCVTLRDEAYDLTLELHYYVFPDCDVITRSAKLINAGKEPVRLERLMSCQIDFDMEGYVFTTFHGAWAREMQRNDCLVGSGKHVNASYTGTSSSRANPFVMLHPAQTTEDTGDCYGFNLIYSGNHMEVAEVNCYGKTRFVSGINPQSFSFVINPGENFEAPEAVMTYSAAGFGGMSRQMHAFVREHVVRGVWKKKVRPILLNSWEAAYFDIEESKLLKLAKAGKQAGIELFVMDDGWFGERNDDTSSLGDWEVNQKKLPGGLRGLSDKIHKLGLDFGIWVEPEMVSVKSKLYEQHPDWAMEIPGKHHSEGRNQRMLDLTRKDVQNFIIEKMTEVFSSADISYVKWDMNRIMSDIYSQNLPADRQGEVAHRYVCGLYTCMRELTRRFPQILFEGCAAGGNRFDLGILCYFPQIWASDDTDALCRAHIQTGYSYGYPMSTVSAHVSGCPNHQTLRTTPLETRFNVAAFGVLGYECNFCDLKKEELAAIAAQIELYKKWRDVLQFGTFYRGRTFHSLPMNGGGDGNLLEWTCVASDQSKAVGMLMQQLVVPNTRFHVYFAKGLDPEKQYHFYNHQFKLDVREFGDLINTAAPVHLKQDSLLLDVVAKFVKLDGEREDLVAYGDTLMYGGVHLKPAFGATGFSDEVRHFPDFGSRLYFMEEDEA